MTLDPPDRDQLLTWVDERLQKRYHTASLGNLPDPLDELVFIQLSIRTPEQIYSRIFENLKNAVSGDWERILHRPEEDLLSVLEPGGMARVKLNRLRAQLNHIRQEFGRVSLDPLKSLPNEEAEAFLISLPGVGPKAARCVLLYSLRRSVFPVDSHCLRVMIRLGVIDETIDRKRAHDVVQEMVPEKVRHSLHVNLVHHGRKLCTPRAPQCKRCPLIQRCPTGQRNV